MAKSPSRKKIIEEILTTEGWETTNADIGKVARTKYEVDLDSSYISSVKNQLKKQQKDPEPEEPTPKKKRQTPKQSEAPAPKKQTLRKTTPKKEQTPPEEKRSVRTGRVVTLDDVREVEQALATSGVDLEPALIFVRGLDQPLENIREVLEWLHQRQ